MDDAYDAWVSWVFDHPVAALGQPSWYHQSDPDSWDPEAHPEAALAFVSQLFREPALLIDRYGADQIGQGLWFLTDPSCSSHLLTLRDPALDWSKRKRAIGAIFTLYERLFQHICEPVLGHKTPPDRPGGLANRICYMFWDLAPLGPTGDGKHDRRCLETLVRILAIPHLACQEGALHGFEEWGRVDAALTNAAIADALHRPEVVGSPDLRVYAQNVRVRP